MRAIVVGSGELTWTEVPDVTAGPGEVLIRVQAAGVNRADLLQAAGNYSPPPGASEILGLEVAGTVAAVGAGVSNWTTGQAVCALLSGGGYAEYVAVSAAQVLPVPEGIGPVQAGGLVEVACTVWSNLVLTAHLTAGEWLLLHGGASGVGSHGIQIARERGARVAVTAGSTDKLAFCRELGAEVTINYHDEDFVTRIREATAGSGVDVILDIIGAAYLDRNLDALAPDGRLVVIGMQGGAKTELNLGKLLSKRTRIIGTTLRGRPLEGPLGKGAVVEAVATDVWPMIADGRVKPVIGAQIPIERAGEAHAILTAGEVIGKVVLTVDSFR